MSKVKKPKVNVEVKYDEDSESKHIVITIPPIECPYCGSEDVDVWDSEYDQLDWSRITDYVRCEACGKQFVVCIDTGWHRKEVK